MLSPIKIIVVLLMIISSIKLHAQTLMFEATPYAAYCVDADGKIFLHLNDEVYPLPYVIELENKTTGDESYYDMDTENLWMTGLSPSQYMITVFFNDTCRLELLTEVEMATGPTDKLIELNSYSNTYQVENASQCNGNIDIESQNSITGLLYYWVGPNVNGNTNQDIINLCQGTYTVSANFNGCTQSITVPICECGFGFDDEDNKYYPLTCLYYQEEFPLEIAPSLTYCTSAYENNGAIDLTISGGWGQYLYSWSGPNGYTSNEIDLENLYPGSYILNIKDGCDEVIYNATFIVEACNYDEDNILPAIIKNTCTNQSDGTIGIWRIPDIQYEWGDQDDTTYLFFNLITGLSAGYYCVTATNTYKCKQTECFQIDEIIIPEIEVIELTDACSQQPLAKLALQLLNDHQVNCKLKGEGYNVTKTIFRDYPDENIFEDLYAGVYNLTTYSSCGDSTVQSININKIDDPAPEITAEIIPGEDQYPKKDGTGRINLTITGGSPIENYLFRWHKIPGKGQKWTEPYFASAQNVDRLYSGL